MHKRLLTLITDSRTGLVITILAGFLLGLLTIGQAFTLSNIIDEVFLNGETLQGVNELLRSLLVIILLRAVVAWGSEISANAVAVRIKTDLRERVFAHLLALGPSYARDERTGELSNVLSEGIEALDAYYSQYVPQLVIAALVPLSILVFVFPLDLLSGIVLLLTAPLIPVFMILIGKTAEALTKRQFDTMRRLSAHFLDSLQGLTTLKQFGHSKSHAGNIRQVSDQFRDVTLNVLRVTFLSALVLELVATLSTAVVAVEVGLRLLYGRMEFQQALFILIIAPEFYVPLRMLGLRFHAGMSGTSAAKRIFEILDTPVDQPEDGEQSISGEMTFKNGLKFENVSFTYPNETSPVLLDITFEIKAGQHIALAGASGAGKSTLASLLLRFARPGSGVITVGGIPLEAIPADQWREAIAWVPQKPHLFHDTIAANLRLARPDASETEIITAAKAAYLHEFIQSLPDGYQSVIGERGARLSGGQAQRLAIARAFLKDAPILILDEPTSSLDPEQESLLEDSVRRLMQGRTVITIAHRLNTIFQADKIIVLEGGQVVESGNHGELLARNGPYANLVRAHGVDPVAVTTPVAIQPAVFKEQITTNLSPAIQPVKGSARSLPIIRLLSFLKGTWNLVGLSTLLGAVTIGSSIALMGTSSYLISGAALHPSIAELQVAIVGVRFFGIARGVFRYLERLASHSVTFRLLSKLRVWFYNALEPLAPARLMDFKSGDLLSRIVGDVETLENFYVRVVSPPLVAVVVTLGMGVFLASFDPKLALALIGFLISLGVVVPLLSQIVSRKPARMIVASRADLQSQLVDGIQGIADLVAFGGQGGKREKIHSIGLCYAAAQHKMALIAGFNSGLSALLTNLGMWVILILAIPLVTAGEIPAVFLATLALTTLASFEAVMPLPLAAQMLGMSLASAKRLFEVVDARPAVSEDFSVTNLQSIVSPISEIKFDNVSFSYGASDAAALNGVSFNLPAGKSLAIVGPSGAGKSTIVNLLQRFWDYETGNIYLSDRSIKDYPADEVRKLFSIVSQNSYFFNATIKQNLLLAKPKATQEQLEAVARQSLIHDFISGLPAGYKTWIGEMGTRLSGGERQRMAIARALLKDTPVLILDEPTANLDTITEQAVLETLWGVMKGRTTLMITHRLVGLEHFDEILVLNKGQVVERGTHVELLLKGGLYRRLWDVQNRVLVT